MKKISIMISSVNKGLEAERDALKEAFSKIEFVELWGTAPFLNKAFSSSSAKTTIEMAKKCNIYMLILSNQYGFEIDGGHSATETEFNAAMRNDPTKIMVFKKESNGNLDEKQHEFIKKVSNYYSGYLRPSFNYSHELQTIAINSFYEWLANRTQLEDNLSIIDHFIRTAKSILDSSVGKIYYKTSKNYVEIEYDYNNITHAVQYENTSIVNNFWGCINQLQLKYEEWLGEINDY